MSQDALLGSACISGSARSGFVYPPGAGAISYTPVPNIERGPYGRPNKREIFLPGFWRLQSEFSHNDILYEWAAIVGELLRKAPDGKPYGVGGMYIEFENNGGADVSPPTVASRGDGRDYYANLLEHPTRDYLRVPLTASTLTSTDEELFPQGNLLTFFAQTQGVAGVHGKQFSSAQQSRVYGLGLVAYPDFGDESQDLLFSRYYYDAAAKQLTKIPSGEIGVEYRLTLH